MSFLLQQAILEEKHIFYGKSTRKHSGFGLRDNLNKKILLPFKSGQIKRNKKPEADMSEYTEYNKKCIYSIKKKQMVDTNKSKKVGALLQTLRLYSASCDRLIIFISILC